MTHTSGLLTGRAAIVSGGSSGIGLWTAHRLAAAGADVALVARDEQRLEDARRTLARFERKIVTVSVDTRDTTGVATAVHDAIDRLGGLDVLVNAAATPAGRIDNRPLAETDPDYALNELDIKAIGYLRTIIAVTPTFSAQGSGRIVNVAGTSVRTTGNLIASLRNAAVTAISQNVADELGPVGVTSNVIHPGYTITEPPTVDGTDDLAAVIERHRADGAGNNLGRLVHAAEIGDLVVHLASDAGAIVNGESFFLGQPRGQVLAN